jgi:hypothetical protein
MATAKMEKEKIGNGEATEKIFVCIPQSDAVFFKLFADKMGWSVDNRQMLWDSYLENSPQNVDLSDDDIMEEVKAVRYAKTENNY